MKKITLSIKDRVIFSGIFAANRDNMTEAAVQRSIIELTTISKNEAEDIGMQTVSGGKIWDAKKGLDKVFELSSIQVNYLKDTIYSLSRSGGVTQSLLPLCEKLASL